VEQLDRVSLDDLPAPSTIPLQVWVDDVLPGNLDQLALGLWRWRQALLNSEYTATRARNVLNVPLSRRLSSEEQAESLVGTSLRMDGLLMHNEKEGILHLIAGKAIPADLLPVAPRDTQLHDVLDPTLPRQLEGFM
jgi:hypothetical protein